MEIDSRTVEVARKVFLAKRVEQIKHDPREMEQVLSVLLLLNPGSLSRAVIHIMAERPGALAELLNLVEATATEIAKIEW